MLLVMSWCTVQHAEMKNIFHFDMVHCAFIQLHSNYGYFVVKKKKWNDAISGTKLVLKSERKTFNWEKKWVCKMHLFVHMGLRPAKDPKKCLNQSGQWTKILTDGLQCMNSPGILSSFPNIFYFLLVHDMGQLSQPATMSFGIMQTVGESWSDK